MRLTNFICDQIVFAAERKAGFHDRDEAIRQRRAAWAEAVRIDALGGKEGEEEIERLQCELKAIYERVPEKVRQSSPGMRRDYEMYHLNVAGLRFDAQFSGYEYDYHPARVVRIAPAYHVLLADNPLTAEFHAIHELQQQYNSDLDNLRQSVRAAVKSVTTTEKLLKVWPECAELLPTEVAPKPQLPALPVADLNAMIGLPSEGGAE